MSSLGHDFRSRGMRLPGTHWLVHSKGALGQERSSVGNPLMQKRTSLWTESRRLNRWG